MTVAVGVVGAIVNAAGDAADDAAGDTADDADGDDDAAGAANLNVWRLGLGVVVVD